MKRAGLMPDGRRLWAYAPGHAWEAWRYASAEAERLGMRLTDGKARSALVDGLALGRRKGRIEVWVFDVEPA